MLFLGEFIALQNLDGFDQELELHLFNKKS